MAFDAGSFERIIGPDSTGNSCWRYDTPDSIGAVLGSGYFTSCGAIVGDMIIIVFTPYSRSMFLNSLVVSDAPIEIAVSGQ
jgi:hypothetical protein